MIEPGDMKILIHLREFRSGWEGKQSANDKLERPRECPITPILTQGADNQPIGNESQLDIWKL